MRRFSSPILRRAWIPYGILIITLLLSFMAMVFAGNETSKNDTLRFTNIVERTQGNITNQMETYITLPEGASGLYSASEAVTESEFRTYVERLSLRKRYPGVQGLGFAAKVAPVEKAAFVDQVRNDGLASYHIWPSTQSFAYPILYLEPLDARNQAAMGYDMYTDSIRRNAMDRAAATGFPAMSGKVTLVQEIDGNKQAGFLIYLPVYRSGIFPETPADREASLQGFIYSPFRGDDLLRGILKGEKSPQVDFQVYDQDIDQKNLLHDSRNFASVRKPSYHSRFSRIETMEFAGRTWQIRYFSNQAFDAASDIWLVPFVFIFGCIVSGVLFILSRAQFEAGRKAEISEANLQYIAEAGKILASSLNYKKTIRSIAELVTPNIADWCSVDLKRDGKIESLTLAHKDQKKLAFARDYQRKNPLSLSSKNGIGKVIRTGKALFYPVITEAMLRSGAKSEEEFQLFKRIGFSSVIIVPLVVHRKVIGAMTFVSSSPKRQYTKTDFSLAEEIAQRAAMAIEHAWVFAESEQAVEMRDEFISVASHELKTPVTSLKMYLQVLHKQLLRKKEHALAEAVEKMDTQIDKLTLLISDLLNVSRIQHGKLEYHDEYFDLNDATSEIVEQVQSTTTKHKIAISGTVKKKVYGDRDRIGQVLTNLLTNAIKYSPDSEGVDVLLTEDREKATVSVKDYGIGIDEKHKSKLFSRFYRVAEPSEKTFPGLGIGLFISHEIVTRHGGMMSVASVKGEGSTFSFTLSFKRRN